MCVFFDTTASQQCREPVADLVSDKQRANFCGYFQINPQACVSPTDQDADAQRQLDALFGGDSSGDESGSGGDGDGLAEGLEDLFRK
jgi:hypothetical protein